jgi:hypothetical protein
MSTETQTFRSRSAAELKNRPTKALLRDLAKLRGSIVGDGLAGTALADARAIERELRGRTKGARG